MPAVHHSSKMRFLNKDDKVSEVTRGV